MKWSIVLITIILIRKKYLGSDIQFLQGLTDTGIRRIHGCRNRYPSTDTDTEKFKNGYGYWYKKISGRIRIRMQKSLKTDTDTDTKKLKTGYGYKKLSFDLNNHSSIFNWMLNEKLLINRTFSPLPIEEDFEMKIRWVKPSLLNENFRVIPFRTPKFFWGASPPRPPV